MMVFSLAVRNLLRNRRRSLTTLSAILVGVVAMLLFGGYARNAIYATQTGYVQFHGHLQIQRKGYFLYGSGNPTAYGIDDAQRIIELVRNDPQLRPMLAMVTPSLRLNGIVGNFANGVSKSVVAAGVVVAEQNQMRKWDDYGGLTYAPPIALVDARPDSVVIGHGVARTLQLCAQLKVKDCAQQAMPAEPARADAPDAPADIAALSAIERDRAPAAGPENMIEMLTASMHGAPNVGSLNVAKAENWGVKEIDDSLIVMHLAKAQRLAFGAGKAQVTAIQIQLQHTAQMPAARARLDQLLASTLKDKPLEVLDYETLTPIYGQIIQFFGSIFGFIAILICVIVLFTVGNTMNMAVVERTTEIGTLRAIGLRSGVIRRLFICEGMLLGVTGAIGGVLIALLLAYLINHSGLVWTPPGYAYEYPVRVRVWGDLGLIAGSTLMLILAAAMSAWWPAQRASKMVIVDALRHV